METIKQIGTVALDAAGFAVVFYASAYLAGEWVKLYWKFRGPITTVQHWKGEPIKMKLEK